MWGIVIFSTLFSVRAVVNLIAERKRHKAIITASLEGVARSIKEAEEIVK